MKDDDELSDAPPKPEAGGPSDGRGPASLPPRTSLLEAMALGVNGRAGDAVNLCDGPRALLGSPLLCTDDPSRVHEAWATAFGMADRATDGASSALSFPRFDRATRGDCAAAAAAAAVLAESSSTSSAVRRCRLTSG